LQITSAAATHYYVRAEMPRGRSRASGDEIVRRGDNPIVRASDSQIATVENLGISRRRVRSHEITTTAAIEIFFAV
jgi:hypothetical protein